MKKIAVLTAGGDAPGMNAAVRSVVLKADDLQMEVLGVEYGFKGLIDKSFISLRSADLSDFIHIGGTRLFTARFPDFKKKAVQNLAISRLRECKIEGLVVIGGNGSSKGAMALADAGFPTVFVPASIDNDMAGTDYSIGFDTALTTAVEAVDKIRDTATSHERIFIVEVMGRGAGDLAYWTAVSTGADRAIIPEQDFEMKEVIKDIESSRLKGQQRYLIILAEGVMRAYEFSKQLQAIKSLNVRESQLGHIQRGGKPSPKDRVLATRLASEAVQLLQDKTVGRMVGIEGSQLISRPISDNLKQERNFIQTLRSHRFDYLF